ncbi:MAG: HEAT repeat domain-containing protein [Actinomycetia bacterium]|nr:HEAT repeat domain-containing protein [Actinomycetes bacterium]
MPASREQLVQLTHDPVAFLDAEDVSLRRMAVTALDPTQAQANVTALERLARGADVTVRTATAEKLGQCDERSLRILEHLASDAEPTVREAVATAYSELGDPQTVPWLISAAAGDSDRHVREAAVAALGSIGDTRGIDPLLEIMKSGPPQVRRRAIAAITVFDDPRIEGAIRRAALDRNPGVREAAEMLVGKQITDSR